MTKALTFTLTLSALIVWIFALAMLVQEASAKPITAEDGSVVPASFYDETDYTPVKAAQARHNHSHKCAAVIGRATDARCEFYVKVRRHFVSQDNDQYAITSRKHYRRGNMQAYNIRLKAAKNACHGTLYEDYSCDGRVF